MTLPLFDNHRMQDITLSEKNLLNQYKELWQAQNWSGVASFLNSYPELRYKIFNSFNINRISQVLNKGEGIIVDTSVRSPIDGSIALSELDYDGADGIAPSIMQDAHDINEVALDGNFYYNGVWTSGTSYLKNQLVSIDDYHLFYCIQNHTSSASNKPTTSNGNEYWGFCKGFLGNLGTEGLAVASTQPSYLTNEDVWVETATVPPTLKAGQQFNSAIFSLVGGNTGDLSKIRSISFTTTQPDTQRYTASTTVSADDSSSIITAYWASGLQDIQVYCSSQVYANQDCNRMFSGWNNCTYFDFGNLDTSLVEDMSNMFYGCNHLQCLVLNNFNTFNVKNIGSMFSFCTSIRRVSVGYQWSISNIDDSISSNQSVFISCSNIIGEGLDKRFWPFDSNRVSYRCAVVGVTSTTLPAYLSFNHKTITIYIHEDLAGTSIGTIQIQQKKGVQFHTYYQREPASQSYNFADEKSLADIDTSLDTVIRITNCQEHTTIRVFNGETAIYTEQINNIANYSYTISAGTEFTSINIFSED